MPEWRESKHLNIYNCILYTLALGLSKPLGEARGLLLDRPFLLLHAGFWLASVAFATAKLSSISGAIPGTVGLNLPLNPNPNPNL